MPNPNDPDQAECKRCFDTGTIVGTYQRCHYCLGKPNPNIGPRTTTPAFSDPGTNKKENEDGC